jgi:molecular chaperone GrpE
MRKAHEIEELKDKYYRALADLDNFKKRALIEKEDTIAFANLTLIEALLPVLDSFERAFDLFKQAGQKEEDVKGIALIKKQFEDVILKAGVSQIEAQGKPFDPNFHEAVMKKKTEGASEGTVLEVLQKGYMMHNRVIRPVMVVVSE